MIYDEQIRKINNVKKRNGAGKKLKLLRETKRSGN